MIRLALRTLRRRKGSFVATFVAMTFGAVIVMACGGLMETGIRSDVPPHRLAGAPLVVAGDQSHELPRQNPDDPEEDVESSTLVERVRLDAGLVSTLADVPGVESAVPDVAVPVLLAGAGPVEAHGWASAALRPYATTAGAAPGRGEVVLSDGHRVGDRVEVVVAGRALTFTVSGLVDSPEPLLFLADTDLERISAHPGKVDAIGLRTEPGADLGQVRHEVGEALRGTGAVVLTGDDRGLAEFAGAARASEDLIVLAGVFGGMAISIALFVVATTLGLSIQQRQRELALLRAIGTTPRQLRRMVLGEALVTSLFATTLGSFLGVPFGQWLFDRLAGRGVVPEAMVFSSGWIPMVVAVGSALLITLVAGLVAGHRAARSRPTEALADAALQRRWLSPVRLILAVLCFGGGIALFIVTIAVMTGPIAASTAGPSVLLWAVGLALVGPGVTRVLLAVFRGPVRLVAGVPGYLAALNTRTRTVRMAAVVVPVMLATGTATANIYLQTTMVAVANEAFAESLRADLVLTSSTGGLDPDLVDEVRRVPGVAAASEFAGSTVFVGAPYDDSQTEDGWPVQGISAEGAALTSAVRLSEGSLEDLRGDTVVLPVEQAATLGRGVGDGITMRMGDGAEVDVRIVGLYPAREGFETLLMPAGLVAEHTTLGLPTQILVRAEPGLSPAVLAEELGGLAPGVAVADREAVTAGYAEQQEIGAWINYLMAGMFVAYTAISVVNSLVMATAARRREFGLHRLSGATRAQVMGMMTVEALLTVAIGIVLGTLVTAATLLPFTLVTDGSVLPSGPVWIYLAVAGSATVLALGATLVTTWLALRPRPAEATVAPA
ncbi:ABC transporter permease [Actinophytocola xanthii]|uniref:ABC transporter permease n=2 Tax=Actinophytocola xanthii TaxID=1912961 RepID=A0A1Q8C7U3_9PSEU|nr:ABC transporter permease [Actinophytocola xanthii]OLF10432.1 ABC transporter permease [Actinophytocola xanthii]